MPAALAQEGENPTIAILRFGPHVSFGFIKRALVDALPAHGLIKAEEHAMLMAGESVSGENFNLIWGDAGFDFPIVNLIVERAIDAGADVLVKLSTPVRAVATALTAEMANPPAIVFSAVYTPFQAGIAQSTRIKPGNITGIESLTAYEDIVPLLQLQDPDIRVIGTVDNSGEISGVEGAKRIIAIAESLGLRVEEAAVTKAADLAPATEELVAAGAEALLIPTGHDDG